MEQLSGDCRRSKVDERKTRQNIRYFVLDLGRNFMKINTHRKLLSLIALIVSAFIAISCNYSSQNNASDNSGNNVSGDWAFVCCSGKYKGTAALKQEGNKISGSFNDGSKIEGEISGNTLKFKRQWSTGTQDYTFDLSQDGKTLSGTFSGTKDTSVSSEAILTRISK